MALLRVSDTNPEVAKKFLGDARSLLAPPAGVVLQQPIPATMTRRAGRHHFQMLVESPQRALLQRYLADWVPRLTGLGAPRSLRWALDVDPLDVF
jgi:primosomal protein N' (replication factor Y)